MLRVGQARATGFLVAVLLSTIIAALPGAVGATGDFTVTVSPASVTIPSGYWADPLLTVTSLNGMTGTVQISMQVGGSTGLNGAGFSTGMTLPPDGNVSVVITLTPGPNNGDFNVPINVTVGSVLHIVSLPVAIAPVTSPDFITRLWGSYSILQGWHETVGDQQVVTSLGGFNGLVSLTASVAPNVPDAPVVSFNPSTVTVAGGSASYTTDLSAAMTTPTGNYVVTVTASSGSISHSYSATLMVGDYRPQTETPPPNTNATTTTQPNNGVSGNPLFAIPGLSPALNAMGPIWWLPMTVGVALVGAFLYLRRRRSRSLK